ncbi:aldehyde dehydrogenase family protein [Streptomyces sp. MP131-18]|uniref:aldehyde dehydrogenase family protein n=1 Tax=Streptomyces sp. MP131-18 TaxID=1857892 RepID=UPI0009A1D10F|nr:aldehyde dehydrogenase family protein [Streptomyces sp. MP131-18]ONK12398.1 putative aldehyde dehydrogenase YfmT [Streptomyces sp. MP131-18]
MATQTPARSHPAPPAPRPAPAPYTGFDRMPIAGAWRAGRADSAQVDVDPYTGDTLTEIPLADASDVDDAYRAAAEAQRAWGAAPAAERAAVLGRASVLMAERADEIGDWLVREAGCIRPRVAMELDICLAITRLAASRTFLEMRTVPSDTPGKENRVYRRPAGVIGVIGPWNFPLFLANRSVAPALAAGNAVVLKPAGDTPVTGGLLLAKIYEEAGLPPGVLGVVIGRGSEIGDAMVRHEVPRVISFTGSTPVGRGIARQAGLKKLALELGGNGPLVVLDDADLDAAVSAAVYGSYFHQGQICMATNRVIVDASIHDAFVQRCVARAEALVTGDPRDDRTEIGPIINDRQLASVREKVQRAVQQGGRLLVSGEPSGPTGRVLPPHLLVGGQHLATASEEVFGPVATIIEARDEDDALALANQTEYGLSSGVFTRDVERGLRFARHVEAGMTHVNDTTVHDDVNAAFGGEKDSGLGRFGGGWVFDEFTSEHWISIQRTPRELPVR